MADQRIAALGLAPAAVREGIRAEDYHRRALAIGYSSAQWDDQVQRVKQWDLNRRLVTTPGDLPPRRVDVLALAYELLTTHRQPIDVSPLRDAIRRMADQMAAVAGVSTTRMAEAIAALARALRQADRSTVSPEMRRLHQAYYRRTRGRWRRPPRARRDRHV